MDWTPVAGQRCRRAEVPSPRCSDLGRVATTAAVPTFHTTSPDPASTRNNLDQQAEMVARAPLVRMIEGAHLYPFMEPTRGDGVVELAVGLFRRASVPHPRRHVLRIGRHVGLGR